ncbi:MAG: mevalonate kinase [Methanomicrobiales archaeon]|nr:mevalonate kinase [Methanomicrobiales archaeon]
MATWSAPGKVFLFGEHAVVYGKPGIAMAIKPRVYVTVRKGRRTSEMKSAYLRECFRQMDVKGSVYIRSQLTSASGLGSSAAVTIATLSAINDEFGLSKSKEEIARAGFEIEKKVQMGLASPTDTYVSTFGGLVLVSQDSRRRLPPMNLPILIGNTGVPHNTGQMVSRVRDMMRDHPGIARPLIDAIEAITMEALHSLEDLRKVGWLMDVNHAILDALGVGHPSLTRLVVAARAAGAFGAKLTGAGGGGCMIAICPPRLKNRVAGVISACDAAATITTVDTDGARKERNG